MAEYELCPNDSTRLWYHTDQLGRLTGRCDTCGGSFRRSVIRISPSVPVMPFTRRADDTLARVHDIVTDTPGIARQAICAMKGLHSDKVRRALAVLVAEGKIREIRARLHPKQDKPTTLYYDAAYDGPVAHHIQSTPELIYDVIAQAPAPVTTDHIAEVVGMTPEHVGRVCRQMVRDHQIQQLIERIPGAGIKRTRNLLRWAVV